ncbi:class F sortase [Agrococcus sp. DT81.2]|uniref:class F sortase n=1 Tax=Agrococcus sp. DT81.2 TaxID=3393414 RepID=UPI003CE4C065
MLLGAAATGVTGACLIAVGVHVLAQAPVVEARPAEPIAYVGVTDRPSASPPPAPTDDGQERSAAPVPAAPVLLPPARLSFTETDGADVVPVGTLPSGALQIPDDPARVGWWAPGALPGGTAGSTVLAGHMTPTGDGSAMSAILELEPGQVLRVEDRGGTPHDYRVVARDGSPREALDPTLFATDGLHRLVLITCGGPVDEVTGRYTENIVVIAEPVIPPSREGSSPPDPT